MGLRIGTFVARRGMLIASVPLMQRTAIVGAGLSGLALAHQLRTRGVDYSIFEARHRFGGRILTIEEPSGLALDFGPTWFWPAENPLLTRLLHAVGVETFEQYEE